MHQPSEHIALTKTLHVADILNQYAGFNKGLHPRPARQLKSDLAKLFAAGLRRWVRNYD